MLFYSRRFAPSHACVVEETSRLGCSYYKRRIAHGQRPCHTTRSTLLELDVLGFKRAIHKSHSTDLATLDFILLVLSRIYEEDD